MKKYIPYLAILAIAFIAGCGDGKMERDGKTGSVEFAHEATAEELDKATPNEVVMDFNPPAGSNRAPGDIAMAPVAGWDPAEFTLLGTLTNPDVADWYSVATAIEIVWNTITNMSNAIAALWNYYYLAAPMLDDEFVPDYWSLAIQGTAVTGALSTICTYDRTGAPFLGNTELQYTDFVPYHAFAGLMQETGAQSIANYTGTGISGECVQNRPTYVLDFALSSTMATLTNLAITGEHSYGYDRDTGNYPDVTIAAADPETFRIYGAIAGASMRFEADYAKPLPPDVGTMVLVEIVNVTVRDPDTLAAICTERLVYVVDKLAGAGVNLAYQFQIDPTNVATNCIRQGANNLWLIWQTP